MPDTSRTDRFTWANALCNVFGTRRRSIGNLPIFKSFNRQNIPAIKRSHAAWLMLAAWVLLPAVKEPAEADVAVEGARFVGVQKLEGETSLHVQGVAFDDQNHILVTSVDTASPNGYLDELDRNTGKLLHRVDMTDGPQYPGDHVRYHAGGLSVSGHSIWVPVAEYTANSSAVIVEIDSRTFQKTGREHRIPDHLGCVAASDHYLIATNWGSAKFYIIDLTGKEPMRVVDNPSSTHYQDMKIMHGKLVASGNIDWISGTIDTFDIPSMKIEHTLHTGRINGFNSITGEGMTMEGDDLYLLPLHGLLFHYTFNNSKTPFARNRQSTVSNLALR